MAAEKAQLILGGDISPLQKKLNEAKEDLQRFGTAGESAFSGTLGPLSALQSKFVAIGALLAGGAVFKEAIAETIKLTEESTKLGDALGISAGEASILREALEQGNTSQDEFVAAAKGLLKQVKQNEAGLNDMGLKTRDAAGELRPLTELTMDAIKVLNGYRAGTDRAIAGQELFGKGFEMTSNLARMNQKDIKETQAQMEALGMVVSEESTAAWKEYDNSTDQANTTLKALKTTIGGALLPVLSKMSDAFVSAGPPLVKFTQLVAESFLAIIDLFRLVKQAFVSVGSDIGAVAAAAGFALKGDFSGAMNVFKARAADAYNETKRLKDLWEGTGDSFLGKFRTLQSARAEPAPDDSDKKSAAGLIKNKNKNGDAKKSGAEKDPMDQSFLSTYEARLAEIKNLYEQEDGLRQFSKSQELAYWQELQQTYTLTAKDELAVAKRTTALKLEIRRAEAKDLRAIDALGVESRRAAAMGQVAVDEQAAQFALENGQITQKQLIQIEEEFARRKFEIEYQALLQRIELAKNDPTASPIALAQLKEQMLQVERDYLIRRNFLQHEATAESGAIWASFTGSIEGLWDKGIQSLLNGTLTWRNAFRAIGAEMASWFAIEVVGKKVKGWVIGEAAQTSATVAGTKARTLAETLASKNSVTLWAATAVKNIMTSAWEAMAGAWKAMVGIPVIGPALGVIAAGVAFKGVSALAKNVSSAEGGYDIPSGVNPLTQLHEKEMVLPKEYANVIRSLAGISSFNDHPPIMGRYTMPQGVNQLARIHEEDSSLPQKYANVIRGFAAGANEPAAGGSGGAVNVHINTMDVKGVKDWLKSNPDALAPAMRRAARNYSPRSTTSPLGKVF